MIAETAGVGSQSKRKSRFLLFYSISGVNCSNNKKCVVRCFYVLALIAEAFFISLFAFNGKVAVRNSKATLCTRRRVSVDACTGGIGA